MGDLQEKILSHMIDCTSESENTNHISKVLGLSQSTVFESILLLEKGKYVQTQQEYLRGRRMLTLTDKGIAAALFSGNAKDKIYSYLKRRAPSSDILWLMNILRNRNDLDNEWIKSFIGYMLCQKERINESNENIMKELIATLIGGPMNDYVDVSKLRKILGPDEIFWLVEVLKNKIKYTNSIIDQLMSEQPNETKSKPGIILLQSPAKLEQLFSEQSRKDKSILKIESTQPKFANTKALKSILDKFYSTSAEKQKDTTNEQEYYVHLNVLFELLNTCMPSDQLKLQ